MAFFGDSHMNYLEAFVRDQEHGDKFNTAFSCSEYLAVGGSTWSTIIDHINAKNLTEFQYHLGNQWSALKKIRQASQISSICFLLVGLKQTNLKMKFMT